MLWDKEVFNKMLDYLEDSCNDILICQVILQEDIKWSDDNRCLFRNEEAKETFMEFSEALHAIKVLRTFGYDTYNDEQDITIKKNY